MALGSRTAKLYLLSLCVFILAAPFFAPGGGYGRMTGFKASFYAVLTAAFLLVSLPDLRREKGFFRSPARCLALGYLFFCLLSALCSPWKREAFLGGSRSEGFLHLALYAGSFLVLSLRSVPRRGLLCAFTAALGLQGLLCLLQLAGVNALGLYPPGLGWADAGLRYPGAYLGTLGNAGQTGAVLAAGAALGGLYLLEKGGRAFLLLPFLALDAFLLSEMDVTGPMLALCVLLLLAVLPYGKTAGGLCRWGGLSALTLALILRKLLGWGGMLGGLLLGGEASPRGQRLPPCFPAPPGGALPPGLPAHFHLPGLVRPPAGCFRPSPRPDRGGDGQRPGLHLERGAACPAGPLLAGERAGHPGLPGPHALHGLGPGSGAGSDPPDRRGPL